MQVYGLDVLGRDVVRGYGTTYLPTAGCNIVREIPLFKPQSSSLLQHWTAILTATQPEVRHFSTTETNAEVEHFFLVL